MSHPVVYVVDGERTPFLKARGRPGPFSAADLACAASRSLLSRLSLSPKQLDGLVLGAVMPSEDEANIARLVGLRLGCDVRLPAYTVQRNCASGMQSIDSACQDIQQGRADLVLAGGVEAMSRAPLLWRSEAVHWLADYRAARGLLSKIKQLGRFKLRYGAPVIALLRGLRDPACGLSMGQTAEILAHVFGLTRAELDAFAYASHQHALAARDEAVYEPIVALYHHGQVYAQDDGVRADPNTDKLAALSPFFDRPFGMVTAGNSSQITDGAAMLLLASEAAVKRYDLPVLGRIGGTAWAGLPPNKMGLGPVAATEALFNQTGLGVTDIDYWEINEAFSAQVLACLRAFGSEEDAIKTEITRHALGAIDPRRVNIDGGAIALGHPVGASGARIVLHLLYVLKRHEARRGIATLCIGGGQGGAMLVERGDI